MTDAYLPPVVLELSATIREALQKIAEAKAALVDFAKQKPNAQLGVEIGAVTSKITTAKQELHKFATQVYRARLGADAAPLWAKIQELRAEVRAMSPFDVKVDANTALAMAKIEALKGALADLQTEAILKPNLGGVTANLARLFPLGGGGGGASATETGLAAWLGNFFGKRGGRFALAGGGAGLLLELSGLSVGHMAVAGLDIAASASGALAGAILKGLGAAGTLAVGMGSNMLVGRSTMADVQEMYQLLNGNPAAGIAGQPNMTYQAAMTKLGLPKDAGTQAEWAFAHALTALNDYWDKATSSGRVAAVKLYTSFLTVADHYIPLINAAATRNFTNLTKDLRPLIKWLDSMGTKTNPGGMRIFKELENLFASHTATGVSAFTNALESLLKTIAYVAPKTGGFLTALNRFFTKLNTDLSNPASKGGQHAFGVINSLLADWKAWYGFFKQLITDVYRLFSNGKDQHTGLAIIQTLTNFLKEFGNFENTAAGTSQIKTIFKASKGEIVAILGIIPPLAKAIGTLFAAFGPGAHRGMTAAVDVFVSLLNGISSFISKIAKMPLVNIWGHKFGSGKDLTNIVGWITGAAVGLGFLAAKLKLLQPAISGILTLLSKTPLTKIPGIGSLIQKMLGNAKGASLTTAATGLQTAATMLQEAATRLGATTPTGAPSGEPVPLPPPETTVPAAGLLPLAGGAAAALAPTAAMLAILALAKPAKLTSQAKARFKDALKGLDKQEVNQVYRYLGSLSKSQAANLIDMASVEKNFSVMFLDIFKKMPYATLVSELSHSLGGAVTKGGKAAGRDLPNGLASGVTQGRGVVTRAVTHLGTHAISTLRKSTGSHSPSVLAMAIGKDFVAGYSLGITHNDRMLTASLQRETDLMMKFLRAQQSHYRRAGAQIMADMAEGVTANAGVLGAAISSAVSNAVSVAVAAAAQTAATKAQQQLTRGLRAGTSWG